MFNIKNTLRKGHRLAKGVAFLATFVGGSLFASMASAAAYVKLATVATSVNNTVGNLSTVMVDISVIAGIGFVIAALFKFHQHKQNPQQVQMGQGISLLLIGAGLTLVPLLIPTASVAVFGAAASSTAQIGGKDIHALIGSTDL